MTARPGVGRRVAVGRVVATADVTALQADPQVKPAQAGGQAVLTARDSFRELGDPDVIAVPTEKRGNQSEDTRCTTNADLASHGRAIANGHFAPDVARSNALRVGSVPAPVREAGQLDA